MATKNLAKNLLEKVVGTATFIAIWWWHNNLNLSSAQLSK